MGIFFVFLFYFDLAMFKKVLKFNLETASLLRSRFLGCHAILPKALRDIPKTAADTGIVKFCEHKTYTHESVLVTSSVVRVPTHFRQDHPLLCLALKVNKKTLDS